MSNETAPPKESWPVFNMLERRILGVLVEKAKTTPDVYPLSVNSLVTGSNQKSNRDPMMNVTEIEVEDSLNDLHKKQLVTKITGGRVERWRHNLYDLWNVSKVELAVLTELLLRGPQTEGELRGRASRMEAIDDLDALRGVLGPLKERGLIVYLGPEGRRGVQLTHGFHSPDEIEHLRAMAPREAEPAAAPQTRSADVAPTAKADEFKTELDQARSEIAALREQVTQLSQAHQQLVEEVRTLKQALGS